MPIFLEICIESVDDAVTAIEAGADRLELNSALALGGVTPSLGSLIEIRRRPADPRVRRCPAQAPRGPQVPVVVMVRPRGGDFCYSAREFDVMRRDIDLFLQHGASGIALGLLTLDGRVDLDRCGALVGQVRSWRAGTEGAAPEGVVFHRAFDFVADPLAAIDELAALGFSRIMTSGQCETACKGAAELARYIAHAAGRIEILPAAGIRPENVEALIRETGCNQVHASLREPVAELNELSSRVQLDASLSEGNLPRTATSGRLVRAMLEKLGRY